MNIGVIFAGGVGKRMNSRVKPKQFIDVYGKPIIIHTLELFENHPEIDAIAVACLENWIPYLQELLEKFNIKKVKKIVPGGSSGQESIYNGLKAAEKIAGGEKSIVLIHDGVRPLINEKTITDNIESVKKKYKEYEEIQCIHICVDEVVDTGDLKLSDKDFNYNTLEPKILKENGREAMNNIFGTNYDTDDEMHKYMHAHKTDCAIAIFESATKIKYPEYIMRAIKNE